MHHVDIETVAECVCMLQEESELLQKQIEQLQQQLDHLNNHASQYNPQVHRQESYAENKVLRETIKQHTLALARSQSMLSSQFVRTYKEISTYPIFTCGIVQ